MTPIYNNPFRESAVYYKQIGWSFVVGIVLLVITGFVVYAAGPSTSMRPTLIRPELAADTAVIETLFVGMPASRR
jgi:cytochrome b subunit of formate dehydrogenase